MNQDSTGEWKVSLRNCIKELLTDEKPISPGLIEAYIGAIYSLQAPKAIYKYFPNSFDRFRTIENKTMWYSAPVHFNDVFDTDFIIKREIIETGIINQLYNGKSIRPGSKEWLDIRKLTTGAIGSLRKALSSFRSDLGISCFCESNDSMLMWAHYASNHKGICVEYELMRFNSELSFTPVPVIYSDQRPCLEKMDLDNPGKDLLRFFIDVLTTKATKWAYEKEWRIIRDSSACGAAWDDAKKGALLPSIKPSSIILGCDASDDFADIVKKYCEGNKVNLFQMEKDESEYKINKKLVLQFET